MEGENDSRRSLINDSVRGGGARDFLEDYTLPLTIARSHTWLEESFEMQTTYETFCRIHGTFTNCFGFLVILFARMAQSLGDDRAGKERETREGRESCLLHFPFQFLLLEDSSRKLLLVLSGNRRIIFLVFLPRHTNTHSPPSPKDPWGRI